MGINKKIKKTLNMYPPVRNQAHYPSGYNGYTTPERRRQLEEFINEDGTYLPKSVLHEDHDLGMLEFVKDKLLITINGKKISFVEQILTTQRWAEFTETWSFSNKDLNPEIPFIVVIRNPAVQYGTNPALKYNIPNRKPFFYRKVPTWDGQRHGMDIYKIPQPVPVDIEFDLKIICNRMRELNHFNKIMMQEFTSRQSYTFVKGHYVPIVINSISDASQISDNEKRKFYSQNYNLQLQGFLIDEEEFEVTPAITRQMMIFETEGSVKKKLPKSKKNNENDTIEKVYTFTSLDLEENDVFSTDEDLEIIEKINVSNLLVEINSQVVDSNQTFYGSRGDTLTLTVSQTDPSKTSTVKIRSKLV